MKIILASGSPRRRELLQQMGLAFEVPSIFAKGKADGFHRPLEKD